MGIKVGDFCEVVVIGKVFGMFICMRLFYMDSVKFNIGYLEGVVGFVGIIKVMLVI